MKHGIMLTRGIRIQDGIISVNGDYDPFAIRMAILYLEGICIPQSQLIAFQLTDELELLKKEGILFEKQIPFSQGITTGGDILLKAYTDCFNELNKTANETWIVHHSLNAQLAKQKMTDDSGECIQLLNALPMPDLNFPLGDLLEFKEKRQDNLKELLITIEEIRIRIISAENKDLEIKKGILDIEKKLIDLNRLIKETKRGWYLSTLAIDLPSQDLLEVFKNVYGEAKNIGMDGLSAFLLSLGISAVTSLNIKAGYRYKVGRPSSPYLYAVDVKNKFHID